MSDPIEISAVGVRPLGEFESVSARVNGRVDTMIVPKGAGETVARLLLAGPVIAAAREVVRIINHSTPPSLRERPFTVVWTDLVRALEQVDGAPIGDELAPVAVGETAVRGVRHGTNPGREIAEAANQLYTGNREGNPGESIFRAVAVAGVALIAFPDGAKPVPYGSTAVDETSPESYRPLAAQLRELADGLDAQFIEHELTAAGVLVRACRRCGCTDEDCAQCIQATGAPCHWVEADLCSACAITIEVP